MQYCCTLTVYTVNCHNVHYTVKVYTVHGPSVHCTLGRCAPYTVQCILYSTVYNLQHHRVHCKAYSVTVYTALYTTECAFYSVYCTLHTVTVYTVQYTLCSIAVYTVPLYSVHCTVGLKGGSSGHLIFHPFFQIF